MAEALIGTSWLARIAFITGVIILFYVMLRLGLIILGLVFEKSRSPMLLKGMIDGNVSKTVEQDPTRADSKPIFRSDNENKGIEYTYSVWIHLDSAEINNNNTGIKHIFNKGDNNSTVSSDYMNNNGPGLYLNVTENGDNNKVDVDLQVLVDLFNSSSANNANPIVVKNLTFDKWICIILRAQSKTFDVFINGVLIHREIFSDIIKQNYGNVYMAQQLGNGSTGFAGKISNLKYYDKAIGTTEIVNIVKGGPDLTYLGNNTLSTKPTYFSTSWYTSNMTS